MNINVTQANNVNEAFLKEYNLPIQFINNDAITNTYVNKLEFRIRILNLPIKSNIFAKMTGSICQNDRVYMPK